MSKLIIYCTGAPMVNGHRRGEFLWSPKHACYIWKGKEYDEREFNDVVTQAFQQFRKILQPLVKVVEFSEPAKPEPTEITVAQAEDVMQRLAPHRLKMKPGPRAQAPTPEVMEV